MDNDRSVHLLLLKDTLQKMKKNLVKKINFHLLDSRIFSGDLIMDTEIFHPLT